MLDYVLKKLDFSHEEFIFIMKSPPKSFYDYPSNYKLIDRLNYFSTSLLKQIFIHKPQSLFQAEMRKGDS
jgi:hypothetical protein